MYWIRGKFVTVRTMEEADAPDVVAWRNRPDAARYLIQWEPLTVEKHLSWFHRTRDSELLLMFEDPAGRLIGCGAFWGFDPKVTSGEWGRLVTAGDLGNPSGLMEGGHLAHRIMFELLGFVRIYCGAADTNTASRKYAEFLGYQQEGFRRLHVNTPHGRYNIVEYGMLADEFEQRSAYLNRFFYRDKSRPDFTAEARAAAPGIRERWLNR
jgi:RimJ/RimL family protein N-acetyltransferase